jgi:hypothetical protein
VELLSFPRGDSFEKLLKQVSLDATILGNCQEDLVFRGKPCCRVTISVTTETQANHFAPNLNRVQRLGKSMQWTRPLFDESILKEDIVFFSVLLDRNYEYCDQSFRPCGKIREHRLSQDKTSENGIGIIWFWGLNYQSRTHAPDFARAFAPIQVILPSPEVIPVRIIVRSPEDTNLVRLCVNVQSDPTDSNDSDDSDDLALSVDDAKDSWMWKAIVHQSRIAN